VNIPLSRGCLTGDRLVSSMGLGCARCGLHSAVDEEDVEAREEFM
jgi:hypothetical protein